MLTWALVVLAVFIAVAILRFIKNLVFSTIGIAILVATTYLGITYLGNTVADKIAQTPLSLVVNGENAKAIADTLKEYGDAVSMTSNGIEIAGDSLTGKWEVSPDKKSTLTLKGQVTEKTTPTILTLVRVASKDPALAPTIEEAISKKKPMNLKTKEAVVVYDVATISIVVNK